MITAVRHVTTQTAYNLLQPAIPNFHRERDREIKMNNWTFRSQTALIHTDYQAEFSRNHNYDGFQSNMNELLLVSFFRVSPTTTWREILFLSDLIVFPVARTYILRECTRCPGIKKRSEHAFVFPREPRRRSKGKRLETREISDCTRFVYEDWVQLRVDWMPWMVRVYRALSASDFVRGDSPYYPSLSVTFLPLFLLPSSLGCSDFYFSSNLRTVCARAHKPPFNAG